MVRNHCMACTGLHVRTTPTFLLLALGVGQVASQDATLPMPPRRIAGVIARGTLRVSLRPMAGAALHRRTHAYALAWPLLPVFLTAAPTATLAAEAVQPAPQVGLPQEFPCSALSTLLILQTAPWPCHTAHASSCARRLLQAVRLGFQLAAAMCRCRSARASRCCGGRSRCRRRCTC